ncbi:fibronectin type III domain-containing protein, partial [Candidatus Berkelbacteria bacterium]|nr:fibronectin type III domain-containing protein [Candidatus Berkelbacteria bacterium]
QNSASSAENPNAPQPPTNILVADVPNDDGGSLQISWDFSTSDFVTGYNIYRRTGDLAFGAPVGNVGAEVKTFIDNTATTGQNYIYRVEALGGAYSAFSGESLPAASQDNLPPRITNFLPVDGSFLNAIPIISATFTENGGFDLDNSYVGLDGNPVPAAQANFTAAGFSYQPLVLTEGKHQIQVKVADVAGNNDQLNTQFIFDTVPPAGALSINQGAAYTNTMTVALVITAQDATSGVTQMALSNDGVFDTELFEPFALEKTWQLTPGDGLKTIYVWFKDAAGNLSIIYAATITLDSTAPSQPTLTQGPLSQTIEPGATLVFEGVAEPLSKIIITVESPAITAQTTADINGFWRITIETSSLNEGEHNVKISVIDALGNQSAEFALGKFTIKKKEESAPAVVTPSPTVEAVIPIGGVSPVFAAEETPTKEIAPETEKISPPAEVAPEPLVEQGKIKPEETKRPADYTRLIITLAILIVAAGAAVGGYYGWEWWMKKGPKPPQGPPPSSSNQTRW